MARRFDGSAAFFLGQGGALNTSTGSWGAWVKPFSFPAVWGGIVGFQDSTGAHDKTIHLGSGGFAQALGFDGGNKTVNATSQMPVGKWTHVCATADGSNLRIFTNGRLEASTGCGGTFTSYSGNCLRVGGGIREAGSTTARYIDAAIVDAFLTGAVLAPGEVAMIGTGNIRFSDLARPLAASWPMRDEPPNGAAMDFVAPRRTGAPGNQYATQQAGSVWWDEDPPPLRVPGEMVKLRLMEFTAALSTSRFSDI